MYNHVKRSLIFFSFVVLTIVSAFAGVEEVVMKYKDIAPAKCKHCNGTFLTEQDIYTGQFSQVEITRPKGSAKYRYNTSQVLIRRFCSCYLKQEREWVDKTRLFKMKFPDYQKHRKKFKKYNDEQFKLLVNYNKAKVFIYLYKRMLYKRLVDELLKDNHLGALPLIVLGPLNATGARAQFVEKYEKRYLKELGRSVKACASKKLFKCTLDEFIEKFLKTQVIDYMIACRNSRSYRSKVHRYRKNGDYYERIENSDNPVKMAGLQDNLGVVKDFISKSRYLAKIAKEASKENRKIYDKSEAFETDSVKNSFRLFSSYLKSRKLMIKELTAKRVILNQHGVEFEVSFDDQSKITGVSVSENYALLKIYGVGDGDISWVVKSSYKTTMSQLAKDLRRVLLNRRCPAKKAIELSIIEVQKRKIRAEEEAKKAK